MTKLTQVTNATSYSNFEEMYITLDGESHMVKVRPNGLHADNEAAAKFLKANGLWDDSDWSRAEKRTRFFNETKRGTLIPDYVMEQKPEAGRSSVIQKMTELSQKLKALI